MNIKQIRKSTNMTQKQFGEYLNIPTRTIQHWENETRKCPDYVAELIEFKITTDQKEGKISMNRTIYELIEGNAAFRKSENIEIKDFCTIDKDTDPQIIKAFDTKEEALEALKKYQSDVRDYESYIHVTEFYIQEVIRNEDDEWVDGGDILTGTPISID